jgi:hypothetical protein
MEIPCKERMLGRCDRFSRVITDHNMTKIKICPCSKKEDVIIKDLTRGNLPAEMYNPNYTHPIKIEGRTFWEYN